MAASVRSVNVDNVKRLVKRSEAGTNLTWTRSFGRHPLLEDTHLKRSRATNPMAGRKRLTYRAIRVGFPVVGSEEPEAEVLFNPGGQPYTPSDITREHLLAVLQAICDGEPVDRDIWARNDPERNR